MKIFLAGATGAIGRQLLPLLVKDGFQVTAMSRTQQGAVQIREQGANSILCDVFEVDKVREAITATEPEIVINQLTNIPHRIRPNRLAEDMAATNRLRREASRVLVDAARSAGARQVISQSVAFLYAPGRPGHASEDDPLFDDAPTEFSHLVDAVKACESATLVTSGIDGCVLRYGAFYGPGTSYARDGSFAEDVARRRVPVIGAGNGVFSFIHVTDAASAVMAAITGKAAGVYNIVDDDPAPVREWLPNYAAMLGARRPMTVPGLVGRLLGGRFVFYVMTEQRGASNAKAQASLDWHPSFPSWRGGFEAEFATPV